MKALILIGGQGTRLRPFTCSTPKPMLPIANKPFLLYQLELIKKYGIKDVVFCVSYLEDCFKKYFGSGKRFGLNIEYTEEKIPLGTGGAVKNAQKYIDDTMVVFNGDVLTDLNIKELLGLHKARRSKITIGLVKVEDPTMFGLVETARNGRIERFIEKPSRDEVTCNTVNGGTYIFEPEVLDLIPAGQNYSLERGLFPQALDLKLPIYGFAYSGYWLDIGTIDKYLQAHIDILGGKTRFKVEGKTNKGVWKGTGVKVGKNVTFNAKALLGAGTSVKDLVQFYGKVSVGKNCRINKGAVLEDCVVLDNTVIGEGVRLKGCVIGSRCNIEPNVHVSAGSALGDNTLIRKFSRI